MKNINNARLTVTRIFLGVFILAAALVLVQPAKAEQCMMSADMNSPDLFQIDAQATSATLFYTPANDADNYFIAFGHIPGDKQYGAQIGGNDNGVQSFTVNALSPNTTYTFVVRGGRGCAPGPWGNELTITTLTSDGQSANYYRYDQNMSVANVPVRSINGQPMSSEAQLGNVQSGKVAAPDPSASPTGAAARQIEPTTAPTATPVKRCILGVCF